MLIQANVEDCASATNIETVTPAGEKRRRWFEVGLVLLVSVGNFVITAVTYLEYGPGALPHNYPFRWTSGTIHEVTSLLLVSYVLSRRGLRFKDLGLRWSLRDVGVGLLLAGLSYAAYFAAALFIQAIHYAIYGSSAAIRTAADFFSHPSIAAIPFSMLNPFFEELIVRAYLMTEVLELTGSSLLAVLLSVVVQSLYHLYYGWTGAVALSFGFSIFAIYYLRTRRALPIIAAHEIFDLYGLFRLW